MNNSQSCVETPAEPEWLSKLENRREKLKQTKLGHEVKKKNLSHPKMFIKICLKLK